MYDIIGDIHGHAGELIELLELLGYRQRNGSWQHPTRQAIFVGDFIDRGPQIREVLGIVRPMCEAGGALAVMGNHEFNALAFHTTEPATHGKYLREHSPQNVKQHAATLSQVPESELSNHLEWFRCLPMWLELDGIRVVHACWDANRMAVIEAALQKYDGVSANFLSEATSQNSDLFLAIEDVLKGKEVKLPEGISFVDKDSHSRSSLRVQWYRAPSNETLSSYALMSDADHHIDVKATGGSDEWDNLICLCFTCHTDVHSKVPFARRFTQTELKGHRAALMALVTAGQFDANETDAYQPSVLAGRQIDAGGLSKEAAELLLAAVGGQGTKVGVILCVEYMSGAHFDAGDCQQLNPPEDKRRFAALKRGLGQLLERGLAEQRSKVMFELTSDGYLAGDELAACAASQ